MRTFLSSVLLALGVGAHASLITLDLPTSRGNERTQAADQEVRGFAKRVALLTKGERRTLSRSRRFSLPVSVIIKGTPAATRGRDNDISLQFDTSGSGAFPTDYRALLESIFATVHPRLTAMFGSPYQGGVVRVANYDAEIGERDAVAGGYFLYDPTAAVPAQIRFPIYADGVGTKPETVAVNFVHCLLLSYMGSRTLPNDAWREGLVRAATMNICRTPGALPSGLDSTAIEQVLESTYDLGPTYDWQNQKGLVSSTFVAPNLRAANLPVGGSTGGLYLVRYLMAGSAFQKVLVEYPTFAKELLSRYYASPATSLSTLGQSAVDAAAGLANSQVEGISWADWLDRQYILQSRLVPGTRTMVKVTPISSGLSGTDFGVFAFESHVFSVDKAGNESLGTDTIYPIYWGPDFTRFFGSAQDDRIDVAQGYGSVVPNFADAFGGQPYRVAVDFGAQDDNLRTYLPAGAIATPANPTPANLYGTVTGTESDSSATYDVRVTWAGGSATTPVTQFAFGARIATGNWTGSQRRVLVELLRTAQGNTTVVFSRTVNKGPGPLALQLDMAGVSTIAGPAILPGLNLLGIVGEPLSADLPDIWGQGTDALIAKWNAASGRYDYAPTTGVVRAGQAYFCRSSAAHSPSYSAVLTNSVPTSIHLRPGWNLISNPTDHVVNITDIQVAPASQFIRSWTDAVAEQLIGPNLFGLVRGANDPVSGVPEVGSLVPVSTLAPGEAVFARVLASDGITLVFGTGTAGREGAPPPGGLLRLRLEGGSEVATGELIVTPTATSGWDRGQDIELPPSLGGLQIAFGGVKRYFREARRSGQTQVFTTDLEGLRVGESYSLSLLTPNGKPVRVFVGSKAGPRLDTGLTYTFLATKTKLRLRIMVGR